MIEEKVERIGNCHKCGKDAAWNSPCVDPTLDLQTAPIWCDRCTEESDIYLVGIEQHTYNGKRRWCTDLKSGGCRTHTKRGIKFFSDDINRIRAGWFKSGSAIPKKELKEHTKDHTIEQALDHFAVLESSGIHYCTGCSKLLTEKEIAGRPLFAGLACKECWDKHLQNADAERKAGHVCRMCRQPYSFCCC